MKPGLLANLGRALALCALAALNVSAQESAAPQAKPDKLVVQVFVRKDAKPSYLDVPGCAFYGVFGEAPGAAARAPADTVQAVDVRTKLEDGRVELKVGVHVGARFFDRLDPVATYRASLGETVEARELEGVGVEPFTFKVLRVSASDTAAPVVENRTQSIAAAVTDFTPGPLPRAKITLTNLSEKRVRAVAMRTIFQGRTRTSMLAFEREGKALMEPGGTYERKVGITDGRTSETDFAPQSVEGVAVVAVVFDDYTFEGDAEAASMKMLMDEGERAQLPRLLRLLRGAQSAGKLEAALAALDDAAPQTSVDAALAAYPALAEKGAGEVRAAVEASMHHVRTELLRDLERFEKRPQAAPAADGFGRWLEEQRARFGAWLARLRTDPSVTSETR